MSLSRTNRMLITAAAMVGVAAGAAGIAGAVTSGDGGQDPAPAVAEQSPAADTDGGVEADEGTEGADEGTEGADEQDEPGDAALADSAAVDQAGAEAAALAEVPGTVNETEIEDRDGTVVWSVEIDGDDGAGHEVSVDATTGAVVPNEQDEHAD